MIRQDRAILFSGKVADREMSTCALPKCTFGTYLPDLCSVRVRGGLIETREQPPIRFESCPEGFN